MRRPPSNTGSRHKFGHTSRLCNTEGGVASRLGTRTGSCKGRTSRCKKALSTRCLGAIAAMTPLFGQPARRSRHRTCSWRSTSTDRPVKAPSPYAVCLNGPPWSLRGQGFMAAISTKELQSAPHCAVQLESGSRVELLGRLFKGHRVVPRSTRCLIRKNNVHILCGRLSQTRVSQSALQSVSGLPVRMRFLTLISGLELPDQAHRPRLVHGSRSSQAEDEPQD